MKKNVMMRVASIMLVLVLMSSSVISGTFAKYVTSGNAGDEARVAKWGVVVTGYADMFKKAYTRDDTDTPYTGSLTVESSTEEKLVAPGTTGVLSKFTATGTPEVAVEVSYDVTKFELNNWEIDGGEYCPIIITVDGEDFYIGKSGVGSVDALESAVIAAIEKHVKTFGPNQNLAEITDHGVAVSWRWAFEGTGHPWTGYQTDPKDTELGNRFAKGEAMGTIDLEVTCTITQID